MASQKQLPAVLRMRAERILHKPIKECYRAIENNPNIARCVLQDGKVAFVDFLSRKEVNQMEVSALTEQAGKEDTEKLVGKQEPGLTSLPPLDDLDEIKDEDGIAGELAELPEIKKEAPSKTKKRQAKKTK